MRTVTAYMVIDQDRFARLQRDGHLLPDPSTLTDEDYRYPYEWMGAEMERRLPAPLPGTPAWPMWAWVRFNGFDVPPPHNRQDDHLVLTLDLPVSEVLLSELGSWEHVLTNCYLEDQRIGWDKASVEWEAFYSKVDMAGLEQYMPRYPDALQRELEASWVRAFDVQDSDERVQATFFTLQMGNVRSVRKWNAPGARRKRIIEVPQQDVRFLSPTG